MYLLLPLLHSLLIFSLSTTAAGVSFNYGKTTAWAVGCDFSGHDLSSQHAAASDCGGVCERTPGCTHFTWTSFEGGTCWMKTNLDSPSSAFDSDGSFVCGFVLSWHNSDGGGAWAQHCDFDGNDIGSTSSTPEACGSKCASTNGCTHFTWSNYNGGTCWFKRNGVSTNDAKLVDADTVCGVLSGNPGNAPPPSNPVSPPPSTNQGERLRITNGGSKTLFVFYQSPLKALPYANPTPVQPGASYDFHIPPEGLESARFWPGWGCNADGTNCKIGASGGVFNGGYKGGDPAKWCHSSGCAPAIDSKFEATFGCWSDNCKKEDFIDISLVDGYTLPYEFWIRTLSGQPCGRGYIDCRGLDFSRCPYEDIGDLHVYDPQTRGLAGCFSPCGKLTTQQWNPTGTARPTDGNARMYCCPPGVTPDECSRGPVVRTKYVALVHQMCPGVYSYAYDDAVGLLKCPAGSKYEVKYYDPKGMWGGITADSSIETSTTTTTTLPPDAPSTTETTTATVTTETDATASSFGMVVVVLLLLFVVVVALVVVLIVVLVQMKRRVEEIS